MSAGPILAILTLSRSWGPGSEWTHPKTRLRVIETLALASRYPSRFRRLWARRGTCHQAAPGAYEFAEELTSSPPIREPLLGIPLRSAPPERSGKDNIVWTKILRMQGKPSGHHDGQR